MTKARPLLIGSVCAVVVAILATVFLRQVLHDRVDVRIALSVSRVRIVEGRLSGVDRVAGPVRHGSQVWSTLRPSVVANVEQALDGFPRERFGGLSLSSLEPLLRLMKHPSKLSNVALGLALEGNVERAADLFSIGNATMRSDAAALRLQQLNETGNDRLALDALVLADRALQRDRNLSEAHFNRALALEKLGLEIPAIHSYRRSLLAGDVRNWAEETNLRIRRLSRGSTAALWTQARSEIETASDAGDANRVLRLVRRFPMHARALGEGEYLGAWADAVQKGNENDAEHNLTRARAVGFALRDTSGESLLVDAVLAIDAARRRGDSGRKQALVRGHQLFTRAMRLQKDQRSAADSFEESATTQVWRESVRAVGAVFRGGGAI